MHGIEKMIQMDIFYHAMNYTSKRTVDVAYGGAFRRKNVEEATQLIKKLAKSNNRAPSEASGSSNRLRGGGVIELNKMLVIEAKLDALMSKFSHQERRSHSANEVGTVEDAEHKCADEGLAHEGSHKIEEAQYIPGS